MKRFTLNQITKFLIIICLLFNFSNLYSQHKNSKIEKLTKKHNSILQNDTPYNWNSPKVPDFALIGNRGDFIMTIGGFIKPIIGWDLGNTLDGNMYFSPAKIPIPSTLGNRSEFFFNPLHSALDFQVVGMAGRKHQITGYLKIVFDGGKGMMANLDAIYIKYRHFLVGYNYSIFTDLWTLPATISCEAVTGNDWSTGYQVSYTSPDYHGFSYGISIEQPSFYGNMGRYRGKDYLNLDDLPYLSNASQSVPDVPAYVQFRWNGINHIRFSGVFRDYRYVDLVHNKVNNLIGWGAKFSTILNPIKPLTLVGQIVYGKGIANYISGLCYMPISYIPNEDKPGYMKATPMLGWVAGAKYYFSKKIFANLSYGYSKLWHSENYDNYKYGLDARGSVFYNIKPYLQWGIEYLWGHKETFQNQCSSISRVQTTLILSL